MRKYWIVAKNTLQASAEYRANWWISIASFIIPVTGLMFLWKAVFGETEKIAGYTLSEIITYYILSRFIIQVIPQTVWREIGDNIRTGELNLFLLRPLNYMGYYFTSIMTTNLLYGLFALTLTATFASFFRDALVLLKSHVNWALFVMSLLGGMILGFVFGTCLCLTAFWVEDVGGITRIQELAGAMLSGALIPLDLLPAWAERIANVLPFRYLLGFQAEIYLQRLSITQMAQGFGLMVVWIGTFAVLSAVMWNQGVKRYAAYGG